MAEEFVLVRVLNMRAVNLEVFDFDYDLTWAAVLLNADEQVYGRFGGRDIGSPDKYLTLGGLRHAMQTALTAHRERDRGQQFAPRPHRTVEAYPAASRLSERACIHCHQAYDFHRDQAKASGTWRVEDVWVYPLPENVGLEMDPEQGNRVAAVRLGSPAARAGLQAADVLRRINGSAVASFADVQYALHRSPAAGTISVTWHRTKREQTAQLLLPEGWKRTDITWRPSTWRMKPSPGVEGEDLSPAQKQALGLSPRRLAFYQGNFVSVPARQAGIQRNDIILGIDGKLLEMTERQFGVYVRLNYKVGDRIVLNVLRQGQRIDVPMTLPERAPF